MQLQQGFGSFSSITAAAVSTEEQHNQNIAAESTIAAQPSMDNENTTLAAADAPAAAETAAPAVAPAAAPVTMKQRKNRGNLRKRGTEDEATAAQAEDDQTAVVRKAKQQRGEPLAFSTKKDGSQDVAVTFASTAAALAARDESATRALETETAYDRDAR